MESECPTFRKCLSLINILGKVAGLCVTQSSSNFSAWLYRLSIFCPTVHQSLLPILCSNKVTPLLGPHTVCCLSAFAHGLDWNVLFPFPPTCPYQLWFGSAITAFGSLNIAMMKNMVASPTQPTESQISIHSQVALPPHASVSPSIQQE